MELIDVIRYFGALFFVLALVGAAGLAIRRFGVSGLPGMNGGKTKRLSVVESIMLGPRHRLFLVRCDEVEHVVVIGPQGATPIGGAAAQSGAQPFKLPGAAA